MNAENFRAYLNDPSLLYQVPYEELKSLALEYPYNPHLRWLLLQKCRMDHRPDARKALEKAAVYSIDRRALYHFVQTPYSKADNSLFVFNEDFLELKDLSALKEELPTPIEATTAERPAFAEPASVYREQPVAPVREDEEEEPAFDFSTLSGISTPATVITTPAEEDLLLQETQTTADSIADEPIDLSPAAPEAMPELATDVTAESEPDVAQMDEAPVSLTDAPMEVFPADEAHAGVSDADHEAHEAASSIDLSVESEQKVPQQAAEMSAIPEADIISTSIPVSEPQVELSDADREDYEATLAAAEAVLEKAAQVNAPGPMPKRAFKSWPAESSTTPVVPEKSISPPSTESKPEKKARKPDVVSEIARQSILENEDLVTETLADLLASQQQYEKAAKMYE